MRFCLICNYISRIDEGLQNEFIRLRFNQLPEENIISFLKNISDSEGLSISLQSLKCIQQLYKSDMRSMINFIQLNQNILNDNFKIIDNDIWEKLSDLIKKNSINNTEIISFINNLTLEYNVDNKKILKDYINYLIRNKENIVSKDFLNFVENIMHLQDCKNSYLINYALLRLKTFL